MPLFEDLQGSLTTKYYGIPGWVYVGIGGVVIAFVVMRPRGTGKATTPNLSEQDMQKISADYEKLMQGNNELDKDYKPEVPTQAVTDQSIDPVPISHLGEPPTTAGSLFTPYYNPTSNLVGVTGPSDAPSLNGIVQPLPPVDTGIEFPDSVLQYDNSAHKDPTKVPELPRPNQDPNPNPNLSPQVQPSPPVHELDNREYITPISPVLPNPSNVAVDNVDIPEQATTYQAPQVADYGNGSVTDQLTPWTYTPPEPMPEPDYIPNGNQSALEPTQAASEYREENTESELTPGPTATVVETE